MEAIDCLLGLEDGATGAILAAMGERGLVEDGFVSAWEKRQPKRERTDNTSTERSRAYRAKQHQAQQSDDEQRHATPCNATQHQKTPRGEESREEKKNTPPTPQGGEAKDGFGEFWECWPKNDRKQDKAKCSALWERDNLGDVSAQIMADVKAKKTTRKWEDGFIEAPLVYLRNRRWEDAATPAETPKWWEEAGFANQWEAENACCFHHNYSQFRDGHRVEAVQ